MASLTSTTPSRPDRQHQISQGAPRIRASGPSGTPSTSSAPVAIMPVHPLSGMLNQILQELTLLKGENAKQNASLAKLKHQQSKLQTTLDELALKSFSIEKSPYKVHNLLCTCYPCKLVHNACICFINRIPCLRLLGQYSAILRAESPPL